MTQLTEADYAIDMEALLAGIGIDPGTVGANTAKVAFLDGKAVLTYTAMRAIPPHALAGALLRSHVTPQVEQAQEVAQEPVPPTPIRPARKRTTKKTAAKK